jgi:hypothetical protein
MAMRPGKGYLAALAFFFFGRVLPLLPRQILPRLLRLSPLPMVISPYANRFLVRR